MNYAYVYYFGDTEKLSEFLVSYESLKATNPKYQICCLCGGTTINKKMFNFLREIGINPLICDFAQSYATKQPNGNRISCLDVAGKIDIFKYEDFDKVVLIDTDTYVKKNIDELFELPDGSMATHHDCLSETRGSGNSGVVVLKPNLNTWYKFYESIRQGYITGNMEYDNDQTFLIKHYDFDNNPQLHLNYMYNTIFRLINEYKENPLFDIDSVKIFHFTRVDNNDKINNVSEKHFFNNRWDSLDYELTDKLFDEYITFYDKVINEYKEKYPYIALANTVYYSRGNQNE